MSNKTLLLPAPEYLTDEFEAVSARPVAGSAPVRTTRRRSRRAAVAGRTATRMRAFHVRRAVLDDPDELRAGLRHATGLL